VIDQVILAATLELLADVGYAHLSIEAIAARAGVGKTTIYRRYASKEELIADAIEQSRPELRIPDHGTIRADLDEMHHLCAEANLSPLGRQTLAMIISLASTSPQFADIYWRKYLLPHRRAVSVIFERAQRRGELAQDFDINLICDLMMGLLYRFILFQPETEPTDAYMRRALDFLLRDAICDPVASPDASPKTAE
jgi:AcrR family transcriptional regulator